MTTNDDTPNKGDFFEEITKDVVIEEPEVKASPPVPAETVSTPTLAPPPSEPPPPSSTSAIFDGPTTIAPRPGSVAPFEIPPLNLPPLKGSVSAIPPAPPPSTASLPATEPAIVLPTEHLPIEARPTEISIQDPTQMAMQMSVDENPDLFEPKTPMRYRIPVEIPRPYLIGGGAFLAVVLLIILLVRLWPHQSHNDALSDPLDMDLDRPLFEFSPKIGDWTEVEYQFDSAFTEVKRPNH